TSLLAKAIGRCWSQGRLLARLARLLAMPRPWQGLQAALQARSRQSGICFRDWRKRLLRSLVPLFVHYPSGLPLRAAVAVGRQAVRLLERLERRLRDRAESPVNVELCAPYVKPGLHTAHSVPGVAENQQRERVGRAEETVVQDRLVKRAPVAGAGPL